MAWWRTDCVPARIVNRSGSRSVTLPFSHMGLVFTAQECAARGPPVTMRTTSKNPEIPMSTATKCDNPMCSCNPCTCADCACGVATVGDLERRVLGIVWDLPDPEPTGREVADALPAHPYPTL